MWPLPIPSYTLESYARHHRSKAPSIAPKTRMYKESVKSINFWVGCEWDCLYCVPSFQRQMKRQRSRCEKCWLYTPHGHLERLLRAPPRTGEDGFIFLPSSSDWAFIPYYAVNEALKYIRKWHDRNFLLQSKAPIYFSKVLVSHGLPDNAILATTIETNQDDLYREMGISKAPIPSVRYHTFKDLPFDNRKMLVIEPILQFDLGIMVEWVRELKPWRIYIGYNSHPKEVPLPEPSLGMTLELVRTLQKDGWDVRTKLLRECWRP